MNKEKIVKLDNIKEMIIFFLLITWIIIPVFKQIRLTNEFVIQYEYTFIKIAGFCGVFFLLLDIYNNSKNNKNNNEYDKIMLPITIFSIYMLWTLFSTLFSDNFYIALNGNTYRKEGYITYVAYAGFFALAFLLKSSKNKKILVNLFVITALLNIILPELRYTGNLSRFLIPIFRNRTVFLNSNHYGYYLLLASICSFFLFITQKNKIKKILYLLSTAVLLYFFMLNDTLGSILAFGLTLLFFIIYCIWKKKIKTSIIFIIIILISTSFFSTKVRKLAMQNINDLIENANNIIIAIQTLKEGDSGQKMHLAEAEKAGSSRLKLWIRGIEYFIERPILGYGPESLQVKYYEDKIIQDRPHNLLLQLATTSGVIGLVTYITAVAIIWIRGLKKINFENSVHMISFFAVTGYLMSAMFGNSMYYTSPYFFIFLGFLMCENIAEQNKSNLKIEEKQNDKE